MNPCQAISVALRARGVRRFSEQAAICGETGAQWSRYRHNQRSPSCAKVSGWLVEAAQQGHGLVLLWKGGQVWAYPEPEEK